MNLIRCDMITKHLVNGKHVIEIENFLTEFECDILLLERGSKFNEAISHYPAYYRNNNRLEEDNLLLSTVLFDKIKSLELNEMNSAIRINEKLRFCQYKKDQSFSKHQDGVYYPNEFEASKMTFLLYLNDNTEFEGGETQFFLSKNSDKVELEIKLKKGKLVIFDHTIWHNGNEVKQGEKYILRSDFIFEIASTEKQHKGYIWCLKKLKDNTFFSGGRDAIVRHWNENIELLNSFKLHNNSIISITEIENNLFVSSSRDLTIKKWDLNGNVISTVKVESMVLSIKVFRNFIITGNTNGEISILNFDLEIVKQFKVHEGWIWDLCIENESIYSVSDDGKLRRTLIDGVSSTILENTEGLFSINIKNGMIYTGSKSGQLITINPSTLDVTRLNIHIDIIRKIKFHDNNIITCSEDNQVKSYQLGKPQLIVQHDNFVQDFICVNSTIFSAGFDGEIRKNVLK